MQGKVTMTMTHELCCISPCIIPGKIGARIDKAEQIPGREILLDSRGQRFLDNLRGDMRSEVRRCGTHCHDVEILVLLEGTVELYDAIFSSKEKQGIPFSDTAPNALPVIFRHRLKSVQKSSTFLPNELYRTRSTITQQSDRRKVVELHWQDRVSPNT